jgi:DNA-binding response OmpR family regulator
MLPRIPPAVALSGKEWRLPTPHRRKAWAQEPAALLISPDREDRILFQAVFQQQKWKLYFGRTLESALRHLRQIPIPVIVAERDLDSGDWKDLLEGTRDLPHHPLLVVVSRLADEYLWLEVLNRGAHDVLPKPFRESEVVRVLSNAWREWERQPSVPSQSDTGSIPQARAAG